MQKINRITPVFIGVLMATPVSMAWAHDPVFSPGSHVLFKDGVEIHADIARSKQGDSRQNQQAISLKYGLSSNWVAGIELPYIQNYTPSGSRKGAGDTQISTKYRFFKKDSLGKQETAAVLLKVKLNSATKRIGSDTTDTLFGLVYGYESLKWYRWASMRYQINQNGSNAKRGNVLFLDIAGGYRPEVHGYRQPDTVWMLELNGENRQRNEPNNTLAGSTGGNQWFLSPGVMWTIRNFAVKSGVQIPIIQNLNGGQQKTDYRVKLEFELHM